MADINLTRSHFLPIAEAKSRVQKVVNELAVEHDLRGEWRGNTLHFERTGLHGEMHVTHSEVRLEVSLGLLLKPLKRTLVGEIERKFDRVFPEPKAGSHPRKPARKTSASA